MSKESIQVPEKELKIALEQIEAKILSMRKEIQQLEQKKTAIFTLLGVPHSISISMPMPPPSTSLSSPSQSVYYAFTKPTPAPPEPKVVLQKASPSDILYFADRYFQQFGPFTTGELAKLMQGAGYYLGDVRPDIRVWSIVKGTYKRNKDQRYEKK